MKPLIVFTALLTAAVLFLDLTVSAEEDISAQLEAMPARAICVYECNSGTVLFEKNSSRELCVSHLAKLMTLLIAAEELDKGSISLADTVTVSPTANAMQGAQIWLDVNEKIPLEELVTAITVGNANDACVALAEHICGSEERFTALMHKKAAALGMTSTHFADSTGLSDSTVSTAADLALLAGELSKHEALTPYLTTWLREVRSGKAQLVSQNRLLRTYKGITGMKACASQRAGECSVVTAQRRDMTVAVVVLGCDTDSNREDIAKKLLDLSFDSFSLFSPEITKKMTSPVPVKGGEKKKVRVSFGDLPPVIIKKGSSYSFDIKFTKIETKPLTFDL